MCSLNYDYTWGGECQKNKKMLRDNLGLKKKRNVTWVYSKKCEEKIDGWPAVRNVTISLGVRMRSKDKIEKNTTWWLAFLCHKFRLHVWEMAMNLFKHLSQKNDYAKAYKVKYP